MTKEKNLDAFKEKFYKKFPNSEIKLLNLINNYNVLVETKYGICKIRKGYLISGKIPKIESAINPTEYFINQAKEVHGNRYDYSLVNYVKSKGERKIKIKIICKTHGIFEQRRDCHLQKQGCLKCGLKRNKSKEWFIKNANKVHNFKYDYSLTDYKNNVTKIKIICLEHDIFEQLPSTHLLGGGCRKCANKKISNFQIKNPNGWTKSNWFNAAKNSKNFDSFKVYIIKCFNETEEFYKIGRTYLEINRRFHSIKTMPYKYEIIKIYEFKELTQENSDLCYDLENELKRNNKKFKYLPKYNFSGKYECFIKL